MYLNIITLNEHSIMKKTLLYLLLLVVFQTMTTKAQISYGDYETFSPNFISFGTTPFEIVANPDNSGINTGNFVGHYISSTNTWEGISVTLDGEVDLASSNTFTMKVYAPVATTVIIQLENAKTNADYTTSSALYTTPNQWQELSFTMGSYSPEQYYNRLLIFFDYPGTTSGNDWYFDDIVGSPLVDYKKQTMAYALDGNNITIDGVIDAEWNNALQYDAATLYHNNTFDSPADLTAYWKAGFDASGIYVLLHVTADDVHVTDYTYGASYEQDLVEVYIDMNVGNLDDGAGPSSGNGHYQASILSESGAPVNWSGGDFNGQHSVVVNMDNSYIHELFIPWSDMPDASWNIFSPNGVSKIGFDVNISDNDGIENGDARNRKVWANNGAGPNSVENWINMDDAGEMFFFVTDTVNQVDREALIAIYNALDGDNWTNNTNWNTSASVSTWYGVTVTGDRVTQLYLSENNLGGTIPAEIGNLTELTELYLDHNQLSGSIPSELGDLIHLTRLDLWVNQLSGSIPAELGNLTNLQNLGLNYNQLTGSIPAELGNLTNLQQLYLNQNQLSGSIPSELGNLTNLQKLYLEHNQLSGSIPSELGNLTNLTLLSLWDNQLTGIVPPELGNLTNLQNLGFNYNQVTGPIPPELGNLTNLQQLYLDNNQLSGSIPSELGNLTNLKLLRLRANQLTGSIPPELGNLDSLQIFSLEHNQLSGSIPSELGNLVNLTFLSFWDNQLTGSIPAELGNLTNLQTLSFSNNQFTDLPDLSALTALTTLYLNDNLFDYTDLETANVNWAGLITGVYAPQNTEANIIRTDAADITLSTNIGGVANEYQWQNFGDDIPGETNPTLVLPLAAEGYYDLMLSNPNFPDLIFDFTTEAINLDPGVPQVEYDALMALYNATDGANWTDNTNWNTTEPVESWFGITVSGGQVTEVNLRDNNLIGNIPSEIGALINLEILDLVSNELSGEIPSEIYHLTNMTKLWLGSSLLSGSISAEIGNLTNLIDLRLYSSQLTGGIPPEIGNLTNLTGLDLGQNQLSGEIPTEIGNLTNLIHLGLVNNQLSGSIPPEIGNLINLYNLSLSINQLSGNIPIEIGNLTNLAYLSLDNNQLSGEIPEGIVSLPSLTELTLHENQFTGLEVLTSTNCSPEVYNNYLTFAAIEPNIAFFTEANQYSPQYPVPVNTSQVVEPAGTMVTLNIETFTDADLGGINNLYQWFNGEDTVTEKSASPEYVINSLDASNEGDYYCEITNIAVPGLVLSSEKISVNMNVSSADFDALVAIYNALGGDYWNNNSGWSTTINDVSNAWHGITVSGGRVTELSLTGNNLTGTIPPEIGNLDHLTKLELYSNNLEGSIPPEIGNLTHLTLMDLDDNQLSGSIPPEIANLTNLTNLYMDVNQLSGSIPSEIGNLINLTYLWIWGNQLTGEIPPEIGNLTNLTSLALINNQLSGSIPSEIGNLTNLTGLYLDGNQLTGSIPSEIGNLSNLTILRLFTNQLSGEIPLEIGNLTNLTQLLVGNNQLSGEIPTEIGNLSNMQHLRLENNQLHGNIPAGVVSSPNLMSLRLYENQFTSMEVLDSASCSPEIHKNMLTFASIEPNIELFTEMEHYSPQYPVLLNTSQIVDSIGNTVTLNIHTLTGLDLGGANNLYQWFKDSVSVSEITASPEFIIDSFVESDEGEYYCAITNTAVPGLILTTEKVSLTYHISSEEFDALVALFNATDGDNWTDNSGWNTTINNVSDAWHGITISGGHVTEIILNNNNLTGIIPPEIGNLTHLSYLDLGSNQLTGEIPVEIGNLTQLTTLYLQTNQLTGSIPSETGNLVELNILWLHTNQLTGSIPSEIGNLTNLTSLALVNNQLSGSIPVEIGNLTHLTALYLYTNQLTGSIPEGIGNLNDLTILRLENNQLTGEIPVGMGNLTNLTQLLLSNNQLTGEIPSEIGNLTNMQYLRLEDNQLDGNIPAGVVSSPNLISLRLYENQFTSMDVLDSANCSPEINSNNLTFAAIEPNIAFFADMSHYSPQHPVLVNTAEIIEAAGATISLNMNTLTDVDLGGANNLYQWFNDAGSVSEISASPEYIISNLDVADQGLYYCQITNNIVEGLTLESEKISISVSCNTHPVTQASNFQEILSMDHSTEVSWTSGSDHVLVLVRQMEAVEHDPSTGIMYNADSHFGNGDQIGDAYVVFNGIGESSTVTGLWPGTEYYFAVYKYDDVEKCYNKEELTGSIVTLGCRPEYSTGSVLDDYIEAVEIGDISNVSGPSAAPFYTYYSNMSTTVETNSTHQLYITGGAWGPDYYAAWIDYNQDYIFTENEKLGEFQLMAFETNSFEFTVPTDAVAGTTTLRVKSAYYGENMDACANYQYGETEDYPINIESATYTVTFSVGDGTNLIDGSSVTYHGSTKNTDVTGTAVFTDVPFGNSAYTITKVGYHDVNGSINVVDSDISENVTMIDSRVATDVVANPNAYTADISWTGLGAEIYRILYYKTGTTNNQFFTASTNPATIPVQPTTDYTVKIKSLINGEWKPYSDAVEFTTLDAALATYNVTFSVGDGTNPIDGSSVTYHGSTQNTDVTGTTVFTDVPVGNSAYTITKVGYHDVNGSINAVDSDISENVTMIDSRVATDVVANPNAYTADISWIGSGAESYRILYYETGTTNNQFFTASTNPATIPVQPTTDYTVKIKSLINGEWKPYSDVVEFTTLDAALATYNVTFSVGDGTNPIDGSSVTYHGSTQNTDVTGTAVFTNVTYGNSAYTITKVGYHDVNGSINIVDSDISENVTMIDSRVATDVVANPKAYTADISWIGSGAESYRILYYETGTTNNQFFTASTNPASIPVEPSTDYTVKIKSLINGEWKPYSDAVEFTTLDAALATYNVTFSVGDGTNPIDGSSVTYHGSTKNTDVTGTAVFTDVPFGNSAYTIIKAGYHDVNGSTNVVDRDIIENVVMVDSRVAIDVVAIPASNTAEISWTGSGAESYRILYYETGTTNNQFFTASTNPATITVQPSTVYTVKVKSLINGVWSSYSDPVEFMSLAGTQQIADNISISNIGSNTADVNWDGSGAESYRILYYETGTTDNQFLTALSSPATIAVQPSTTYTVKVKSWINGVWSSYSNPVEFTSAVAPPVAPAIASLNSNNLVIKESFGVIYPNPAIDVIHVPVILKESDDVIITIIDMNGGVRKLFKDQVYGEQIISLDISDLNDGMYILNIKSSKESRNQQFIKE